MRNAAVATIAIAAVSLAAAPAAAQLALPQPSPLARVMQRVGLTEITVEYSSPGVKGRAIWGGLVPFDAPWRTGANAATQITFGREVTFAGKPVAAGTYALVTIPRKGAWTVILSRDLGLWAAGRRYDPKADVLRVEATPAAAPPRERMTFLFSNTTEDATSLDLEWEKLRLSIPIAADTKAHAQAAVQAALKDAWRPHAYAARWVADANKDYDTALAYLDRSIAVESNWFNNWLKADVLARKGKHADALRYAKTAWALGEKSDNFFLRDQVKQALEQWPKKK